MWNNLTLKEKAELILAGVKAGYRDIDSIRKRFNSFSKGNYLEPIILRTQEQLPVENVENSDYSVVPKLDYYKDPNEQLVNKFDKGGNYTVGNLVDAIYLNNPKEEYLGKPSHNYDFTQSEEWANAHGYYPDARGHRDDRVKKPAHPSHPSRGNWEGDNFILTDKGFEDPNYTLFGLNDGGQDPLATLIYDDAIVLPEITVTPNGNYINNSYDNIRLHLKSNGGSINKFDKGGKKSNFIDFITGHKEEKKQAAEEAAEWAKEYYLSEGFKERMKKLPHYYNQYRELYYPNWNHSVSFDYTLPEDPEFKYSNTKPSSYDTENDIITVGTRRNPEDYYKIINHELGHKYAKGVKTNIDTGEGTVTFEGGHYNYYPVFREGKQYLEALNNLTQADKRLFETYPESMAEEVHHDALPGENYADLISLRAELDKANIYDSNKSNNVFTKEHLDKAREYGITSRLFDNFDDDAIILMMNDVAHTTINDSGNNYAANGGKINRFDDGGLTLNTTKDPKEWIKDWYTDREDIWKNNQARIMLNDLTPEDRLYIEAQESPELYTSGIDSIKEIVIPNKAMDDYSIDLIGSPGIKAYNLGNGEVILSKDSYSKPEIRVHELIHGYDQEWRIPEIYIADILDTTEPQSVFLNAPQQDDYYFDDPKEIYARLMQFRNKADLDPKKVYNLEDVKKWRDSGKYNDEFLFDRYKDEFILKLLNEVADNQYTSNTHYANLGGHLKKRQKNK